MKGAIEEFRHVGLFNLSARVHDNYALAGLGNHAEIMGDQNYGSAYSLLQLQHEPQDLCLNGDVERRRRLVGDEKLRVAGKCHCDMMRWRMPPEN